MATINDPSPAVSSLAWARAEAIATIALPSVAVVLRLWSRGVVDSRHGISRFWWDDWLILISLPFAITQGSIGLYWTTFSLAKTRYFIDEEALVKSGLIEWLTWFLWGIGTTISKFSVLCFYARIFGISKSFSRSLWVTGFLNSAWGVGTLISTCLLCSPLHTYWTQWTRTLFEDTGHCHNVLAWTVATAVTNAIIDLIILLLPVRILYRLNMSLRHRFWISCAFLCGYGVIAFSIGRCVLAIRIFRGDFNEATTSGINIPIFWPWLCLENSMCIVCACLPMIFALCRRAYIHGLSSIFTTKSFCSRANQNTYERSASSPGAAKLGNDQDYELDMALVLAKPLPSKPNELGTIVSASYVGKSEYGELRQDVGQSYIHVTREIRLAFEDGYSMD